MDNQQIEPRLYIIMREDIWDMNPGKAIAQGAHAQALFLSNVQDGLHTHETECILNWKEQTAQGFGTTIVLSAPIDEIVSLCQSQCGAGQIVIDPTYPYRNHYGKMFTISTPTCGYFFAGSGVDPNILERIKKFPLHP